MNTITETEFKIDPKRYCGSDAADDILEHLPKKKFISVMHFYQYAPGITGCNRRNIVISGPDKQGFDSKKEARAFWKTVKHEFKNVKGAKDEGYGSVGQKHYKAYFLSAKQLAEKIKNPNWYHGAFSGL